MLSPIFILLLIFLAYVYTVQILKQKKILYTIVWIIMILVVMFKDLVFLTPLVKGYVGFAFFYVVMITGALDPKWKLTKRLKSVRTAYSVLGFTLLIAHPLSYSIAVISGSTPIPWLGLGAFLVMIPLFITSYISVRKRMKAKTWKNLHKWAYLSYLLILIHLIVNASTVPNRIVAILLFLPYIILKTIKETKKK
jgi:DMSO/TMAO reductase YedYZ heme-binding membrane subunit